MTGLRFAMLTTFYPPYNFGGDGIGIERFINGLLRRGHEVEVIQDVDAYDILRRGPLPEPPPDRPGLVFHRLRSRFPKMSCLLTQQLGRPVVHGRRIREILDRGRFDVVNFHNVSLVGGPGLLEYGSGVKLYMAHEHWLVCPSHVLWRDNRELCDEKRCISCQIKFRRPPQLWRMTGFLERKLRHVDAFIAMSDFSKKKHEEFGFPREMETINYFLPDESGESMTETTRSEPRIHDRPYVLFVGRLEKIKGLDGVIPLFKEDRGVDLLIAGDGDHGAHLRQLGEGLTNVRFLGRIDQEKLRRYYQDALALVVPSVCFETFGIILIESFRQGTPVIARHLGPFPEIVARSNAGLLFRTDDELLAAIVRFRDDPAFRAQCSENGKTAFKSHWTESAVIPQYLDLVRRTAEKKGLHDIVRRLSGEPALQRIVS